MERILQQYEEININHRSILDMDRRELIYEAIEAFMRAGQIFPAEDRLRLLFRHELVRFTRKAFIMAGAYKADKESLEEHHYNEFANHAGTVPYG